MLKAIPTRYVAIDWDSTDGNLSKKAELELAAGFGINGGSRSAREVASAHVRRYAGRNWLACDCKKAEEGTPIIYFRSEHIVRHRDFGPHALSCPFYRTSKEQRTIVNSYRVHCNDPLNLVTSFRKPGKADTSSDFPTPGHPRNSLATLLAELLTDAGIQDDIAGQVRELSHQRDAIERVARRTRLNNRVCMADFLSFDAAAVEEFKSHIQHSNANWSSASRAHGILITTVHSIRDRAIHPHIGDPIPVRGKISVWAEIDGERRLSDPLIGDQRQPYIAIALFSRTDPEGDVECQKCYVHPCRSEGDLMMVDSRRERETIDEILEVRRWVGRDDVALDFRKPLFDEGAEVVDVARPVLIPDFILLPRGANAMCESVLVETMGYDNTDYRDRKNYIIPLMKKFYGAELARHDFSGDRDEEQSARDRRFRGFCRRFIAGRF